MLTFRLFKKHFTHSGGGFRIGCLVCPRLGPSLSGGDPTTVLAAGECGAFALRHRLPEAWLEGPGQRHNEMDDFEAFGPHEKWIYIIIYIYIY